VIQLSESFAAGSPQSRRNCGFGSWKNGQLGSRKSGWL
jgi:hypothetical protein